MSSRGADRKRNRPDVSGLPPFHLCGRQFVFSTTKAWNLVPVDRSGL
jgi:hypothetical protein